MFDHFWQPPPIPLPGGVGFGLFSGTHILILGILAVAIAFVVRAYRRSDPHVRRRWRLWVAGLALGSDIARMIAYAAMGVFTAEALPLWMCSVGTWCIFIDSLKPNRWTREWTYAMTIWGAVCALVFADWANRPWFNIFSWQSFIIHACLIAYGLMLIVSGELRPNWKNLWRVVVMMAVVVPIAVLVNHVYGTNFWFLNSGSPGSPLDPILQATGSMYIPTLILLLAVLWTAMYLPWSLRKRVPKVGESTL